MNNEDKNQGQAAEKEKQQGSPGQAINPFENHQSVEKDIRQAKEEVDKEQQFKEALTERD